MFLILCIEKMILNQQRHNYQLRIQQLQEDLGLSETAHVIAAKQPAVNTSGQSNAAVMEGEQMDTAISESVHINESVDINGSVDLTDIYSLMHEGGINELSERKMASTSMLVDSADKEAIASESDEGIGCVISHVTHVGNGKGDSSPYEPADGGLVGSEQTGVFMSTEESEQVSASCTTSATQEFKVNVTPLDSDFTQDKCLDTGDKENKGKIDVSISSQQELETAQTLEDIVNRLIGEMVTNVGTSIDAEVKYSMKTDVQVVLSELVDSVVSRNKKEVKRLLVKQAVEKVSTLVAPDQVDQKSIVVEEIEALLEQMLCKLCRVSDQALIAHKTESKCQKFEEKDVKPDILLMQSSLPEKFHEDRKIFKWLPIQADKIGTTATQNETITTNDGIDDLYGDLQLHKSPYSGSPAVDLLNQSWASQSEDDIERDGWWVDRKLKMDQRPVVKYPDDRNASMLTEHCQKDVVEKRCTDEVQIKDSSDMAFEPLSVTSTTPSLAEISSGIEWKHYDSESDSEGKDLVIDELAHLPDSTKPGSALSCELDESSTDVNPPKDKETCKAKLVSVESVLGRDSPIPSCDAVSTDSHSVNVGSSAPPVLSDGHQRVNTMTADVDNIAVSIGLCRIPKSAEFPSVTVSTDFVDTQRLEWDKGAEQAVKHIVDLVEDMLEPNSVVKSVLNHMVFAVDVKTCLREDQDGSLSLYTLYSHSRFGRSSGERMDCWPESATSPPSVAALERSSAMVLNPEELSLVRSINLHTKSPVSNLKAALQALCLPNINKATPSMLKIKFEELVKLAKTLTLSQVHVLKAGALAIFIRCISRKLFLNSHKPLKLGGYRKTDNRTKTLSLHSAKKVEKETSTSQESLSSTDELELIRPASFSPPPPTT